MSTVSFGEFSIKSVLGKLSINGGGPADMPRYANDAGFTILPLEPATAATVANLPPLPDHRDAFDRILVWTAMREKLHLVSCDRRMDGHAAKGLKICW
jgi:PIN domain nuclease of toxin-antitoxin system